MPNRDASAAIRRQLSISVVEIHDGGWESDVEVNGGWVGGGTAPTASGAIDVAMSVLYGDKSDWLNGQEGALHEYGLNK